MKQTRYTPDSKKPFGFHDCHINGMEITDGNLRLELFYTTSIMTAKVSRVILRYRD